MSSSIARSVREIKGDLAAVHKWHNGEIAPFLVLKGPCAETLTHGLRSHVAEIS